MAIKGLKSLVTTAARHTRVRCPEGLKQGGFVGEEVLHLKFWLIRRGRSCWMDMVSRMVGTLEVIRVQESASILLGGGWATLVRCELEGTFRLIFYS
jgi:hypothetical protein